MKESIRMLKKLKKTIAETKEEKDILKQKIKTLQNNRYSLFADKGLLKVQVNESKNKFVHKIYNVKPKV